MQEKIDNIKNLSNDDLLSLHAAILEHLKYLEEQIISTEVETVEEENTKEEENVDSEDGDKNE